MLDLCVIQFGDLIFGILLARSAAKFPVVKVGECIGDRSAMMMHFDLTFALLFYLKLRHRSRVPEAR